MVTMEVPTATSLRDIYPDDSILVQKKRWENLLAGFRKQYGRQAEFVSRSPGRVNIIGEVRVGESYSRTKLTARSTLTTPYTKSFQWL
jgi:hypothetical protein